MLTHEAENSSVQQSLTTMLLLDHRKISESPFILFMELFPVRLENC